MRKFLSNINFPTCIANYSEEKQMYCLEILDATNEKILTTVYFENDEDMLKYSVCEINYKEY